MSNNQTWSSLAWNSVNTPIDKPDWRDQRTLPSSLGAQSTDRHRDAFAIKSNSFSNSLEHITHPQTHTCFQQQNKTQSNPKCIYYMRTYECLIYCHVWVNARLQNHSNRTRSLHFAFLFDDHVIVHTWSQKSHIAHYLPSLIRLSDASSHQQKVSKHNYYGSTRRLKNLQRTFRMRELRTQKKMLLFD